MDMPKTNDNPYGFDSNHEENAKAEKQDQCRGENALPTHIKLCCDARQKECKWFHLFETDTCVIPLCMRAQWVPT